MIDSYGQRNKKYYSNIPPVRTKVCILSESTPPEWVILLNSDDFVIPEIGQATARGLKWV
ncbi:hypothetical protein LINPERPRIM_LOCUS43030 [Linum perenne]